MLTPQRESAGDSSVTVVLIAPDEDRRREITAAISGTQARIVREFCTYPVGDALSSLVLTACDVIIVDLDTGVEAAVGLIGAVCARNALVTVMACSSHCEGDVVIRSMRAGAREFLTEHLAPSTVAEAFTRAAARRQHVPMERSGKVIIFHGAKGGVGTTTLAINFAVALAAENTGSVVLVDLLPQLGEIALGLGLAPKFSITDAVDNAPRLDADFLSTLLVEHSSGVMVLASSDVYGSHVRRADDMKKVLGILRNQFAYVVVDSGSCSGNRPDAVFDFADTIYLVAEVNLPALRNARRLISWYSAKENNSKLEVVLNRFNSRKIEIDEESTTRALARPADWRIPNDYPAVRSAQNLGQPLVLQDTAVSRAIGEMVSRECGRPAATNQPAPVASKGDKWKFWTSKSTRPLSIARS